MAPRETPQARLKRLRSALRTAQMTVRMDIWSLSNSRQRAKNIGAKMRAAAAEIKRPRRRRRSAHT